MIKGIMCAIVEYFEKLYILRMLIGEFSAKELS